MRKLAVAGTVLAIMAAPTIAISADTNADTSSHQKTSDSQSRQTAQSRVPVVPASALLNAKVEDVKGMEAGKIEYLMIDAGTGKVSFAVLSDDRAGELIPVPWQALHVSKPGNRIQVKAEKAQIGQASRYRLDALADVTRPAARTTAYEYWAPLVATDKQASGQTSGDRSAQTGAESQQSKSAAKTDPSATPDQSDKMSQSTQTDTSTQMGQMGKSGQMDKSGQMNKSTQMTQADQSSQTSQSETSATDQSSSQLAQGSDQGDSGVPHILVGHGYVTTLMPPRFRFAEQISGSVIEGSEGEDLGEIDEVMIDVQHGQVAYVQVARGGFLGLDEKMVPVPLAALAYVPGRNTYRLDMPAQKFQERKAFTPASQSTSVRMKDLGELYRMYDAEPYWQQGTVGQSNQKKG